MNEEREFYFKIVVIGDAGVGKTSLIIRYVHGLFKQEYIQTLGTQISKYNDKIDNILIKLMFWDLAGQISFDKLRKNFYNGTSAAIIVFSHEVDTELGEKSFKNIFKWSGDIRKYAGNIPIILFGNKIDLIDTKSLENNDEYLRSDSNINELIRDFNFFGYYKTSALSGEGVTEAFKAITSELVQINK